MNDADTLNDAPGDTPDSATEPTADSGSHALLAALADTTRRVADRVGTAVVRVDAAAAGATAWSSPRARS